MEQSTGDEQQIPQQETQSDETIILNAAKTGNLSIIQQYPPKILQSTSDSSGCTILHWASGNNHLHLLDHLLTTKLFHPDTTVKSRKAKGRTPLHYACRNGHLGIVKTLVENYNADMHARAKHGVTPFQLAVWQNQLHVCKYLTFQGIIPKEEVNDFGCGIIHWMGIMPSKRCENILQLAKWIFAQDGIDIRLRQNQGRTVLHKASWGGHFDLVKYLHKEQGMDDDVKDLAGNYAADLCDMANTENHNQIAFYLRKECSSEYRHSCELLGLDRDFVLGLDRDTGREEIRKAYLLKAKECHPDRGGDSYNAEFQLAQKAYEHLMGDGISKKQKNPAHSIDLLLEMQKSDENVNMLDDEMKLFKPRLLSVLLEYGEKGIDLSNLIKVWDKIWPDVPFPLVDDKPKPAQGTTNSKRKRKKGQLLRLIEEHAGDVINVIRHEDTPGSILIAPKNIAHKDVQQLLSERREVDIATIAVANLNII